MRSADKPEVKEEALRRLSYIAATGKFYWLPRDASDFKTLRAWAAWTANNSGKEAGCIHSIHGYRSVKFGKNSVKVHRLVWLFEHGDWPDGDIDHINGVRDDNRIENLRVVTRAENCRNKRMPDDNTSGVVGVGWNSRLQAWIAQIKVDQKSKHLGVFKDKSEAIAARLAANKEYGFHENHGRA